MELSQQLRMFMRPGEILDTIQGSADAGAGRSNVEHMVRGSKLDTAQGRQSGNTTLYESIRQGGVRKPIILYPGSEHGGYAGEDSRSAHFWLGNGHHRVASAEEAERATGKQQYIPVVHDNDFMGQSFAAQHFGIAYD